MRTPIINLIVAALMAIVTMSCEKSDISQFEGAYTFKTSGKVALLPTDYVNATDEEKAYMASLGIGYEQVWVALQPEQGQMHIRKTEDGNGSVIITFNDILGNACKASGVIDGNMISIQGPEEKTVSLTDGESTLGGGFVIYSGDGIRYEDLVTIDFTYQGSVMLNDISMTIVDSKVECIATKNK